MITLITGASGFVGKNLAIYLKEQKKGLKFLRLREDWDGKIGNDITNIIHLAGKAHDLKSVSKPEEYYNINFELTKRLYDAFLKSGAKKFVFISTVKAVADNLNDQLTEEYPPCPQTHYGRSKLMAEDYIRNQILPEGKSYFILRPCMIHGPGNKGNLNLLYRFVLKGIPYPLGAFENKRSYLSVENLCFIISELLYREDIPSGIYNVSDDEALSTSEVVTLLSNAISKAPRLLHVPKKLVSFLAKMGDYLKLPLNTEKLEKLTENYQVSNQKIIQILKKKLPLTAREGILKTAQAFKNC